MKPEDTHRYLNFVINHSVVGDNTEDFHYLDIAKVMSQINRRLYRQGGTYHIANITVHDGDGDCFVKFGGLPTTWASRAAWQQAFQLWKKQRASVQDVSNLSSKWSDFKVYLNDSMRTDTTDEMKFEDIEEDHPAVGEWDYSEMLLDEDGDNSDSFFLHMMGTNNGSLSGGTCVSAGLLANFEDVLQLPTEDPEVPQNASLSLFTLMSRGGADTELNKDLVDQMELDNKLPPYSPTAIPGAKANCASPWNYREVSIKSAQSPSAMLPGFSVPLGLLCIETKSATNNNKIGILIELVPGKYKGVAFDSWA